MAMRRKMCRTLHIARVLRRLARLPRVLSRGGGLILRGNRCGPCMAGCVHRKIGGSKLPEHIPGRELKMRFSLAVAIVLAGISVSGLAQQTFKVKRSAPEKAPRKSAPVGKGASPVASNGTSKELQTLERQTAKTSAPSRSLGKKTPGTGSGLKPVKDKSNPPINFGGTGGGKGGGTSNQGSNPYKGRLKQKHSPH
jgi:hypothetical protein